MGNMFTHSVVEPVNYSCPVCINSGKIPNLAGKFFIINEKECQCNGCGSKYPKEQFYKNVKEEVSASK